MPFWTYQNLKMITAGAWLVPPPPEAGNAVIPAARRDAGPILWHDTREIQPGQVYLAIAGENFDGNRFVPQAFAAGAALAIVDSESAVSDQLSAFSQNQQPVLRVDDSVKALQQLARAYRQELSSSNISGGGGCKVIGIAGSNGKTTTRHLIHHVLTHAGKTGTQSPKSFNNHLGVPLTLLAARPTDDFVACEIGTNHPGEIDFLSEIAKPDIAVITSIGEEHLEFFGDLDGVADEEFSIVDHIREGRPVVTGHLGPYAERLAAMQGVNDIPAASSGYHPPDELPLLGEHNRINAIVAWCVARWMGLRSDQCDAALRTVSPPAHRGELIRIGQNVLIIDDCYNANPSSMREAIDTLRLMPCKGKRVAVLGDMLELGERSHELHTEIGWYAMGNGGVYPFLIGKAFQQVGFDMFVRPAQMQWSDDLPEHVAGFIEPGDTVLLKASRGMRLERLIPAIEKRFGKAK